ncbi:LysM peptidoglycan-binding domain-containing protein [Pseudomonas wadenswilerensis]
MDGFLDKGAVVAGVQAGQNLGKGYTLSYDAAGRRIASERWLSNASGQSLYERSEYAYNDLSQVQRRDLKDVYRQSGANSGAAAQSVSAAQLDLVNTYDERGRVLTQTTYKNGVAQSIARSEYRGDNQKISERTYGIANGVEYLSQANYFAEAGMIDAAGNQTRYRYAIFHASGNLHQAGDYLTTYVGFETYKSENLKATAIGQDSGITNYSYNDRGDLLHVSNHDGKFRRYAVDGDGRMISAQVVATDNTQLYLNYQNGALANAGAISRGAITDTLVPISADYPAHAPSSYVVNQGDTLESIAQMVWGDRSMWYVIADANGLSDTLMVGSSLRIPNVVSSNRNDATTFKPYNPAEVIGDTITPPVPPKPKKKKCNAAASIVMVVVAVVATIFTAGAALAVVGSTATTFGGLASAAISGGIGAVTAGGVTAAAVGASGLGLAGMTAVYAGAAVVGSLASQTVGKAMGVVDQISWKQAAVAGLAGGIAGGLSQMAAAGKFGDAIGSAFNNTAGVNNAVPTLSDRLISYGAQGTFNYTANYVSNRVVGLDTAFSWKGMAATVAGSIVAGTVSDRKDWYGSVLRGQIGAQASAMMRDKWFGGGDPDYGQVAADAFGNSLVDYMVNSLQAEQRSRENHEESQAWMTDHEGEIAERTTDWRFMQASNEQMGTYSWRQMPSGGIEYLTALEITAGETEAFNPLLANAYFSRPVIYDDGKARPVEEPREPLYRRALNWSANERMATHRVVDPLVKALDSSSLSSTIRMIRAGADARYDAIDAIAGMAGFMTDKDLRKEIMVGGALLLNDALSDPQKAFDSAAGRVGDYLGRTGVDQLQEDAMRFFAGGVAMKAAGRTAVEAMTAGMDYYKYSIHVPELSYRALHSTILVPNIGIRVTTVTAEMRARFQGSGFVNPMTNKFELPVVGEVLEVDHKYPSSEIVFLPNFDRLTKGQMENILQDKIGLGNLQALPKRFNASKGAKTAWSMFKMSGLDPVYEANLVFEQERIQSQITIQINTYLKQNAERGL